MNTSTKYVFFFIIWVGVQFLVMKLGNWVCQQGLILHIKIFRLVYQPLRLASWYQVYQISNFQTFITDELVYDTKLYDKSIPGMYTLLFLRADKNDLLFFFFFFKVMVQNCPLTGLKDIKKTYKRLLVKRAFFKFSHYYTH